MLLVTVDYFPFFRSLIPSILCRRDYIGFVMQTWG